MTKQWRLDMKMIPLTKGKYAKVDNEDYEYLSKRKWHYSSGYASSGGQLMHRVIMNAPSDMQVDHKDQDKLNNQRSNLRLCTSRENRLNTGKRSDNISGFKGVTWRRDRRKWQAGIKVKGKNIHLKMFLTIEEAARAYDEAAKKYFGDHAWLNFPD
jgi:hypothetical protein